VTLLEFEGALLEEQEQPEEAEVQIGKGVPKEELPECPDYRPSTFLKGKPRCMLTHSLYIYISIIEYFYLFIALSCRS
jgi:hypothetical protein